MAFDITSVLGNVSGPDTEQIEYLPLDILQPDPNNFYLLDGLEELAANIELIGLQQPLRVRPAEERGQYVIVSGHRRKAACMMIRDGGSGMFDRGVPCIVERAPESEAMRELRLIYANAATRVMSPAEISKQAERVEMLLYQLKEEGHEFPGRMRDHVAEACKVSKTKLARLHAIRKNLAPDLLVWFDRGGLSEASAYAMSQQEPELQRWIFDQYKATHGATDVKEFFVRDFAQDAEKAAKLRCRNIAGGGDCIHQRTHVEKMWRHGYRGWDPCIGSLEARCCADCENLASCSVSCQRCEPKKKKLKADLQAKRKSERETKQADEQNRKDQEDLKRSQAARYWARLGGALKDAGLDFWTLQDMIDRDKRRRGKDNRVLCTWRLSPEDIQNLLDGKPANNEECELPIPIWEIADDEYVEAAQMLCETADLLGVSIDYLMLHSDEPKPAAKAGAAQWQTGTPTEAGMYECRVGVGVEETPQTAVWQRLEWTEDGWAYPVTRKVMDRGMNVFRWTKLPEV